MASIFALGHALPTFCACGIQAIDTVAQMPFEEVVDRNLSGFPTHVGDAGSAIEGRMGR